MKNTSSTAKNVYDKRENFLPFLFMKICTEYKNKILRRVFGKRKKMPWMKSVEIEIIEKILKNLKPCKCLEWGAGWSTLYFQKFLRKDTKWISVEHNNLWAEKIRGINKNVNCKIYYIKPTFLPRIDKYADAAYPSIKEYKDYVNFPHKFKSYDFVLIDGRARKDCLIEAYKLIKNKGIVILHDANKRHYDEISYLYKYQLLLKDYRNDLGGLWIGSKELPIDQVLNVDNYSKLYWFLRKFGKVFRL